VGDYEEMAMNMVGEEALAPGAGDIGEKIWVPPDMINVKRDAEQARALRVESFANVKCMAQRIHAGVSAAYIGCSGSMASRIFAPRA
jgi:hypothetical protein